MSGISLKSLVVDDSKIALLDLQSKLSHLIPKENIYLAQSYFEAISLLDKHDFGIAFIDLQMPDKTGMDLIFDVIRKNPSTKNLPVVVTTGVEPNSLISHSLKSFTFRYLFKPISIEELKEALSKIPSS